MLANSTGQNVANQAALMAGQRGAGQNAGMLARQAAMQGANTQQQAAGQGAALQANQSLNALGQMGSLATNQANQYGNAANAYSQAAQGAQSNILNGIQGQNNAAVGMQSNINNVSGQLANNVATQQGGMFGSIMNQMPGMANMVGGLFGGGSGNTNTSGLSLGNTGVTVPTYASDGSAIAPVATSTSNAGDLLGGTGLLGSTGANAISAVPYAKGGQVKQKYADGGSVGDTTPMVQATPIKENQVIEPTPSTVPTDPTGGPQSNVGKMMASGAATGAATSAAGSSSGGGNMMSALGGMQDQVHNLITGENVKPDTSDGHTPGLQVDWGDMAKGGGKGAMFGSNFGPLGTLIGGAVGVLGGGFTYKAKGGMVPAMVSPGEKYLSPDKVEEVKEGKANPIKDGKTVPGKPKVGGAKNSYANDTVPATLEEGGIVIPRSITQGKDAERKSMEFVAAVLRKHKG